MNLPFRFALQTSTTPIGRLFEYTAAAAGYDMNNTLYAIGVSADVTGATAALKLATCGIVVPAATTKFRVRGFSLTFWASADVAPKVDIGLVKSDGTFVALYEGVACGTAGGAGGGIQKTFGPAERGIYVPQSATLLPAIRVTKQTATDGAVTVAGDLDIVTDPA